MRRAFMGRMPVRRAISLWYFRKHTGVQKLLHQLKYHGDKEAGVLMGIWLGRCLLKGWEKEEWPDCFIPMPISGRRRKKRGYNQAELICKGLYQATGIPIRSNWVIRNASRGSQTKLGRWARWVNVSQEFELKKEPLNGPIHVMLIDDVMTTGASLESLGQCFTNIEGVTISIGTIAYTDGM